MGRALVQAIADTDGRCRLSAAWEAPGTPHLGEDIGLVVGIGSVGVVLEDSADAGFQRADMVIDFSSPAATAAHLVLAEWHRVPMVIGTTGLGSEVRQKLESVARLLPMVYAPNFSVGINLMLSLITQSAAVLGESVDIEIIEAHHRHKVDAPSGTAIRLGEAVAGALGRSLEQDAIYGREGITGARERRAIGFATVRGGDIVGDHTVLFAGEGERLEITHRASSRATFARGAVRAAEWAAGQPPGLYDMQDVLAIPKAVS
jgi:4-hydroxy-tetrahydrodipicolinate reductase